MNLWKVIAIILIIVCLCSLLLKACGNALSKIQSVPKDYTNTVKTDGEPEAKYLAMGQYEVEYYESATMMSFQEKSYKLYYQKGLVIDEENS